MGVVFGFIGFGPPLTSERPEIADRFKHVRPPNFRSGTFCWPSETVWRVTGLNDCWWTGFLTSEMIR